MKQVLLFPELDQPELNYEQLFLAIVCRRQDDKLYSKLAELSPKVMPWVDGIYLVDLGFCSNYWKTLAAQSRRECIDLWKELLQKSLPDNSYYGALSPHPWRSLLLAYTLEEVGMKGLFHIDGMQGKNIFPHVSWELWWRTAEELGENSIKQKLMTSAQRQKFRQNLRKMQIAMKRLACQKPIHIQHMQPPQMKRRYGDIICDLWAWSYHNKQSQMIDSLETTDRFPWQDYTPEEKPRIKRNLDFPLLEWSVIEELLRDDLNCICLSPSFNEGQHIMSLEWRLVLHDLSEVTIPVFFRNPHHLHDETPHQRTALLQIQYQFEEYQRSCQDRYQEVEQVPPPIVSWVLEIKHCLARTPSLNHLFDEHQPETQDLFRLENQVAAPLTSYQLVDHWVPEDSYKMNHQPGETGLQVTDSSLACKRPLFTYRKPQPFKQGRQGGMWKFTERTMDKWWLSQSQNVRRDYYQYVREDEKYWVFRDIKGHWYIHGIFA
ncbi:hypothetical protein [Pseudobacteriovorax antillogorgiicola]|uniref:Protein ImuB n=1 Tax=Pseudobacteriovorax antillogorgiicola TaxID=1513793 RepID=A0A1Y6CR36_9BACT|nr:hypothetical protein [Pseudobacteriovorax antillogorgiicola]TCS45635.1 hypothetical protein EDD56_12727 [Pseudobacteriovorax antillogorgiicola]SMF72675.1 hypothetical protein SAMN06296036_12726 [Pseudobacteriovorax antillogorgiicola]